MTIDQARPDESIRTVPTTPTADALAALVSAHFEQTITASDAFFMAERERIARACWAMAARFHRGGRLLAFSSGAAATDAQHVAVEFVHPVIVGKRA